MNPQKLSLLMSVYQGDTPEQLSAALRSVALNSVVPDDIVIVIDGPISSALHSVLLQWSAALHLRLFPLAKNGGLGEALSYGLQHCKHDWVARFDADDLCLPHRFEAQLRFIRENPGIHAFSSPVLEFSSHLSLRNLRLRSVPVGEQQLREYAIRRNPFNHMSVVFYRPAVQAVGGYKSLPLFEDYGLWVRILLNGSRLNNMSIPCVYARAGGDMLGRRRGWRYVCLEYQAMQQFRRWGFLTVAQLWLNLGLRLPLRLLPPSLVGLFYSAALRR